MILTQIPTEQTTAATDLLISVLAIASAIYLRRKGPAGLRGRLWRSVLYILAIAALLGALVHGLVLGSTMYKVLWWGTYLSLSLLIAAFFLATVRDLFGDEKALLLRPASGIVALGFFAYFAMAPEDFLPFILYESAIMLFSLATFVLLALRNALPGSAWIAASIAVNIVAAAIQASGSINFTLIWPFDHNGTFHLVQIVGMALLVQGLRSHPSSRAGVEKKLAGINRGEQEW